MNEDRTTQPGTPKGELSIADISALAGSEFASWLCVLFGGEDPGERTDAAATEVRL